ncbi:MAG: class I SAM-dependent DNA methyltransferase [Candidatus Bipolaricaulota bacterium]|nr:class I SAM-dependent DNA methyltransferase [Candidatus Bipolaricaulota bacterium]
MPRKPPAITPQEFVAKWRASTLKESSASQEHFIDLCRMLGHETPAQADSEGVWFTFERGADKSTGGQGWADVWKKGFFAWEYKGKHKDLDAAYAQLLRYCDALLNPPLLVVSDMETIVVHTNFNNTVRRDIRLTFDDLTTEAGQAALRAVFTEPERLRADETPEGVTKKAAADFSKLAESLRDRGVDSEEAAHFLIRILFCLFAEDIKLLPDKLVSRLVAETREDPTTFGRRLRELFGHMAKGGYFGLDRIPHFNGGLFDDDTVLDLSRDDLRTLHRVSQLDWSSIEPSILGTLFERGLDPSKRSQIGAHYTSRDDILLIVEPVLMRPLRRRWEEVRKEVEAVAAEWRVAPAAGGKKAKLRNQLQKLLHGFADEIADTKVLDPACGSGNFLYVALRELLNLEKEVIALGMSLGFPYTIPTSDPRQLYGIEINEYAHELAQATVWIGYIQWLHENGFGWPAEPLLKKLGNIEHKDAILAFDADGNPIEPEWPEATVVIGNPPFLGGKLLRNGLGDEYVDHLFALWDGRVARESDICCYWFEKAHAMIEEGTLKRAGLLATQGIRGGANRKSLERIKDSGDIFWAQSDRDWILDGATVHVSMVGFDGGAEPTRELDGHPVQKVNPDLTASLDFTKAARLPENSGIAFMGDTKGGPFDITDAVARQMLAAQGNPNGRPNSDVVLPWINARDITGRSRGMWIIDFGTDSTEEWAAGYDLPFSYVVREVRPGRDVNKRDAYRERYWIHVEARPTMRAAISPLARFLVIPRHTKHHLVAWLRNPVVPDSAVFAFARDDDYFFGVLHSKLHELWALRQGTQLEDRPRYTPTTCFETFPFPWQPGKEPVNDPRVQAIAAAAKDLVEKRDRWLNPEGATEAELKKRTLTNLYNQRPTWLDLAHKKLDQAVLDAYAWPHDLTDDQILERLLALNLERASGDEE